MYQEGQTESTNGQQNRASGRLSLTAIGGLTTIPLLFSNPPLESLTTSQAHLALTAPLSLKFPRDVAPFCAVRQTTRAAFEDLRSLFEAGESSFIVVPETPSLTTEKIGSKPSQTTFKFRQNSHEIRGLFQAEGPFGVVQMAFPEHLPIPDPAPSDPPIAPIEDSQVAEMVALTDIAFPGFFRIATNRMGPYYGIRSETTGELVAMAGERMNINNFHELSGLCTHPDHRGKGYAQMLMLHLMRLHKSNGCSTYLHASTPNTHAIQIYQHLGYTLLGEYQLLRLTSI